uniref:Uncharacterized protein n=1 Tax=Arundo donax TaxID=35708 RepID=A0A0A9CXZ7_ARUDO
MSQRQVQKQLSYFLRSLSNTGHYLSATMQHSDKTMQQPTAKLSYRCWWWPSDDSALFILRAKNLLITNRAYLIDLQPSSDTSLMVLMFAGQFSQPISVLVSHATDHTFIMFFLS